MLSMRTEASIAVADLRFAGITCAKCGTETVLDLSSTYRPEDADLDKFTPPHCPTCNQNFNPDARRAVEKIRDAYQGLLKVDPCPVVFRRISVESHGERRASPAAGAPR